LYGFFIERAIRDLVSRDGYLSYIIPHTLLSNDSFSKLRKLLLEECTIKQVIDIGPSVFSGASNETMTFLVCKSAPDNTESREIWVRNTTASSFPDGEPQFLIEQRRWLKNSKYSWPVRITGDGYKMLDRLKTNSLLLGSLCTINQGLRTGNNKRYIRGQPDGAQWKPVVGGKDIGLYEPIRPKDYVFYDPSVLDAPRKEELFTSEEKIIVQEIRNISLSRRIVATLDTSRTYALQSTNVINWRPGAREQMSLKYILAIINSSTVNYYFRLCFPGNNHIASNQLATIPVHRPTSREAEVCDNLVSLVMHAKRMSEEAQAKFVEDLIDACVMECYFHERMAGHDLVFLEELVPHFVGYDPEMPDKLQRDFLADFYRTLNTSSSKIRNRLLRLTADSPDFFGVIKKASEG
jgi:hypothetical protein